MKRFLFLLVVCCLPVLSLAQSKGTWATSFGLNGVDGDIAISGELGYYFVENLETGLQGSYGSEGEDLFAVGPYAEYYFDQIKEATSYPLLPFVGVSGSYYSFDGESTTGVSGYGGVRFMFSSGVALYTAYEYRTAGEKIFVDDGKLEDSDGRLIYGLQLLF